MLNITYIKHAVLNILKKPHSSISKLPKNYRGCIEFNSDKCINCKKCIEVCASKSISDLIENTPRGKRVTYKFDMKTCVFCGLCRDFCPKNAITFNEDSKIISRDKNEFLTEGTLLIEDYKANRNEVLSVTQPIKVTQIEELLTTLHGEVDVVYEENKKTEEKEAQVELIKLLFDEDEVEQVKEKPIEKEEIASYEIIKIIDVENVEIRQVRDLRKVKPIAEKPIAKETKVEENKLNIGKDKLEETVIVNNKELLKELFSEEEKERKTIKDSIFETTANLKDLLKNIWTKKDEEQEGQEVQVKDEKKDSIKGSIKEESTLKETSEPAEEKTHSEAVEESKHEHSNSVKETKPISHAENPIDMNATISTAKSRELLQELFPEKDFEKNNSKNDSQVQVIYKREDFADGKLTHTAIKKDVLPKLFPENYEGKDDEKEKKNDNSEISAAIYTTKKSKVASKPKDTKKNHKKSNKKKK